MNQEHFDFEPPYQVHSETSREAAERIEPNAATLRAKVLRYIRYCGECGATDEEIQEELDMNPSTERPRRIELWRGGFIRDSGLTRRTQSNRRAVVWVAVLDGTKKAPVDGWG